MNEKARKAPAGWEAVEGDDLNGDLTAVKMREMSFDMSGFTPRVDFDRLTLTLPVIETKGPVFTSNAIEAMREAGFSDYEMDAMYDDFVEKMAVRMFSRLLLERKVKR